MLSHIDRLLRKRIDARVVHRSRYIKRSRNEVLHLIRTVVIAFQKQRQIDHRMQVAAGMAGDVIRDDELLLTDSL